MPAVSDFRVCPECRNEFVKMATHCGDCDVALVWPDQILADEQVVAEFPAAAELECVREAPIAWIQALSQALQERGLTHRVEPVSKAVQADAEAREVFGNAALFGLYLRSGDLAEARELDRVIAVQVLPGEAPDLEAGEEESCPACGAALGPSHSECPDCGLAMG